MARPHLDLPTLPDVHDPNAIVRAFAANPAFRAAERHELSNETNPFRRPVRPDDLNWLDYSTVLPESRTLMLTALLGHRMLRNIYDSDQLYLPPMAQQTSEADGEAFYSTQNRVLAALAKPVLERHLFTMLDQHNEPLDKPDLASLRRHIGEYHQRRTTEPGLAHLAAMSTRNRVEAATFVLLQYGAFVPASSAAVARGAIGEYQAAHPRLRSILLEDYRQWTDSADSYEQLLMAAGLTATTGAYWQLCLGSSLARGNYLHHLAGSRERVFSFIGAFLHKLVDEEATRPRYDELIAGTLDTSITYFRAPSAPPDHSVTELVDQLVAPLAEKFGDSVIPEVHAGFVAAARLEETWDRDLADQITWADRLEEYKDKADKLAHHIETEGIEVDLDTFVESSDETSTTHVHDDHRLVMIEKGQMHFWNNITHKIGLDTGDRILIPACRLHGSTVLSGDCTYHQPIIPEEMLRKIG